MAPLKFTQRLWMVIVTAGLALVMASCDNGPFEKAGKAIDRADEKVGDKIKDITK